MPYSEEERKLRRAEQQRRYVANNPEKRKATEKKFYETHGRPKEYNEPYARKYRKSAKGKATRAAWREANREKINADQRERARNTRDYCRGKTLDYLAKKRTKFVERVDRTVLFARDDGVCQICGKPIAKDEVWWVDHVHPISKGGEHSYANTQVSHRGCNIRKGSKIMTRDTDPLALGP